MKINTPYFSPACHLHPSQLFPPAVPPLYHCCTASLSLLYRLFIIAVPPLYHCCTASLSLAGAATSIIFVATNVLLCLSRQNCLSREKLCLDKHTFIATKDVFCHDKHMFVVTNVCLSRQKFCRNEHVFIATKETFVHVDKPYQYNTSSPASNT